MSVVSEVNERLRALTEAGTSVWLDQIRRGLVEGGELRRLIEEDSLRGVTSNPAIFEKAILGSDEYDDELAELARQGLDARSIYDELAIGDVRLAADVLRPVHEQTSGHDGFVSLEVSPDLAHDMERTLDQAREYWRRVDRPNLMIKIPGTDEGLPAIEQAIFEGINVNVTLLFSVEAYAEVMERFIRGLESRLSEGRSLDVHSVASFFVSRVDSEVDKRLEEIGREDLYGLAGLANARAAYARFKETFHGERFAELRSAGAPVQRPLWASTGVKNPRYPDTMYVDGLVAPQTVNTMPMQTLLAAAERTEVEGPTADQDPTADLEALEEAGIDMAEVTDKLLRDGIEAFVKPMEKLVQGIDSAREAAVTGRPATIRAEIPEELAQAIADRVRRASEERVAQRIWRKDDTLWGEAGVPEVGNRLGWLTVTEAMREALPELRELREDCRSDGLTDAVLLGMGGSSLAPEVIRRSFRERDAGLRLHVLDSTDPGAVLSVERAVDLGRTLFIVSSKSGGTVEPMSLFRHFHARVREAVGEDAAGRHFMAITDPGTSLVALAREHGFRRILENDPDIGGRYSALSYFGLVPAALMGVDVEALLDSAEIAEQACANYDHSTSNQGLWLGLSLGELALRGRDKLTLVVSEPLESFGLWAEQLIAESTGKEGRGVVPVAGEPLGEPGSYGEDRVFCWLRDPEHAAADGNHLSERLEALADAGHPVFTLDARGAEDLGRIFFFAEFGTAVAGWVLGINPFDQPNVQEAKDNTAAVLERHAEEGALPAPAEADEEIVRRLLGRAEPPAYVAIMGYLEPSEAFDQAMAELREVIRDATRAATTFGYGPRFLHSTGQLHKGGPETGIFLQLVHDGEEDLEIPDAGYSFQPLKHAQAIGDLETLRAHSLPAERLRLEGDPAQAVRDLAGRLRQSL
ncbi:MAG TPA: bifunctional transaldolase/phosoglucose isomerase [Thermoleophilaceae bacterium]|nr:bifunctional transaldolase/phosoglucose isomerase [Thermoleophilaceae bacterium]